MCAGGKQSPVRTFATRPTLTLLLRSSLCGVELSVEDSPAPSSGRDPRLGISTERGETRTRTPTNSQYPLGPRFSACALPAAPPPCFRFPTSFTDSGCAFTATPAQTGSVVGAIVRVRTVASGVCDPGCEM